jgi:predicted DNA-binding transcriptional regulator AlpA
MSTSLKVTQGRQSELPTSLDMLRVLVTEQSAKFCGYAPDHWRALHRAGKTPPAIRLSSRKYGWRVSDLVAWQEAKKGTPSAV